MTLFLRGGAFQDRFGFFARIACQAVGDVVRWIKTEREERGHGNQLQNVSIWGIRPGGCDLLY